MKHARQLGATGAGVAPGATGRRVARTACRRPGRALRRAARATRRLASHGGARLRVPSRSTFSTMTASRITACHAGLAAGDVATLTTRSARAALARSLVAEHRAAARPAERTRRPLTLIPVAIAEATLRVAITNATAGVATNTATCAPGGRNGPRSDSHTLAGAIANAFAAAATKAAAIAVSAGNPVGCLLATPIPLRLVAKDARAVV